MSDVTSANLEDLGTFIQGSRNRRPVLADQASALERYAGQVASRCSFQHPDTPSAAAAVALVDVWHDNERFVKTIRDELRNADRYDENGNPLISDAAIQAALQAKGLDDAPALVDVRGIEMTGQPPYSGFVDDPICLANGNLLHQDLDLELPGVVAGIDVVRSYNSLRPDAGVFGPGWTTLADVHLDIESDRSVVYHDPEGGGAPFSRRGDGSWTENRRRRLVLAEHDGGWVVEERRARWWHFDADGALIGLRSAAVDVTVDRSATEIRLAEQRSGRWVTYQLDPVTGLASSVETSDGRRVTYEYDDGRLVRVERAQGDVSHGYDEHGFLERVTDADGITLCRNTFDAEGRVLTQVEHHGRETAYDYAANGVSTVTSTDGAPPNVMVHDRRGRMTAMIDGLGNTMRLRYDDDDNLVQVVDRSGAVTRFDHDERGNRIRQVDPDGGEMTWEFDDLDRPAVHTDRLGATSRFTYDDAGRAPVVVEQADGTVTRMDRDARGLATSLVDPDGVTMTMTWNDDGLPTSVVDGVGGRHTFDYDRAGRLARIDLPTGDHLSVGSDQRGRPRTVRTPTGEREFEFSDAGRLVGGREADGVRWRAHLDHAGDVERITDTAGAATSYERDIIGQITAEIDAAGHQVTFEYDPVGRCTAMVDRDGHRTETRYDPVGRPTEIVDADGASWSFTFDELSRLVATTDPTGATRVSTYHPDGSLATHRDAEGNTWAYEIDVMGRVTAAIDPLGHTTSYGYTAAGRLAEVRSPLGKTLRQRYDAAGRVASIVEPDGTEIQIERAADGTVRRVLRGGEQQEIGVSEGQLSIIGPRDELTLHATSSGISALADRADDPARFDRDISGLLERVADPAGVVTEFVHDERGRLLADATAESGKRYTYDAAGRLASATDAYEQTTSLVRDRLGRISTIEHSSGVGMRQRFDGHGGLVELSRLDGTQLVAIDRDRNGQVVAARSGQNETRVERDPLGRVASIATAAGTVRYERDADGDVARIADAEGFAVALERSADSGDVTGYVLADGRRVGPAPTPDVVRNDHRRVEIDEHGRRFRYDRAGRLIESSVGEVTTTYGYDDRGLLATERTGDLVRTHRYGMAGELVSTDEAGGRTTYDHDALGRRVAEHRGDGSSVTYEWDDLGRLVAVTRRSPDGTESTRRIEHDPLDRPTSIDGAPVLWDDGATGRLLGIGDERYLWSGAQVCVVGDDATWSRRIPDDPWGHDGGAGARLGYRGELALDDLLFLGDRVYDTRSRCFLSRDPLPSLPGALTFAGIYSYAWCDPVNFVDPSGRRPLSDEEFDEFVEEQTKGWVDKIDWKKVGVIALTITVAVVATAVMGPIGGGIVAGFVMGGGMSYAQGNGWKTVLKDAVVGGLVGGLTGGLGKFIGPTTKLGRFFAGSADDSTRVMVGRRALERAVQDVPSGFAEEGLQSVVHGRDFSLTGALINSGTNMGVGGLGDAARPHVPQGIRDAMSDESLARHINDPAGAGRHVAGRVDDAVNRGFPDQGVPNPGRYSEFSGVSRDQLTGIDGIGDTLADRILRARDSGQLGTADDLTNIPQIGGHRADLIRAELGL